MQTLSRAAGFVPGGTCVGQALPVLAIPEAGQTPVDPDLKQACLNMVPNDSRPSPMDRCPALQEIVTYGRQALGAVAVLLFRFERDMPIASPIATALSRCSSTQRWQAGADDRYLTFGVEQAPIKLEMSPSLAAVRDEGRAVCCTVRELLKGAVDERATQSASSLAGLRFAYVYPVVSPGGVVAALAVITRRRFSERQRHLTQMLTQQIMLAVENARLLDTLGGQIAELDRSRRAVVTREEDLRKELAELLHGRVQTHLLVAWHQLRNVERLLEVNPAQAPCLLSQVREELDRIREHDIRQVSHLLHPSVIQVGLIPAVRSLIGNFEQELQISLETDPQVVVLDDPGHNRIPKHLRLVVYRALEEALSNVYRHAHATTVRVSLTLTPSRGLRLVVRDDGQGFSMQNAELGLGLTSIAARVEQAKGVWFVASAPARGTLIRVELPLGGECNTASPCAPAPECLVPQFPLPAERT